MRLQRRGKLSQVSQLFDIVDDQGDKTPEDAQVTTSRPAEDK